MAEVQWLDLWKKPMKPGAKRMEWMGMGVAGIVIDSYYG